MQDGTGTYSYFYDELSRMHTATTPAGKTITYAFDALGQRASMIDPDGGRFTYAYDARSLISHLINPQSDRTSFAYDAGGRRSVKKLANGTRASFTYDEADNLTLLANLKSDGTTISSFEYAYDNVGNRTHVVEANGDRVTWSYDKTYQLTNERRSGANAYDTTYSYDPAGNRLVKNDSGTRTTYAYDEANQLETTEEASGTTTYTFDANGNQQLVTEPTGDRTTYTWDFENRTTLVQLPSGIRNTMAYRPDGLRVRLDESTGTKKFIWDGKAYLMETDDEDAAIVVYTNEPTIFGNLISQRRDGATSTYHFDGVGSARALANASEIITDAYLNKSFGEAIVATGPTINALRFVGEFGYYLDEELSQFYVRARVYGPGSGRWTTVDPSGLTDGTNRYKYVQNATPNAVDPGGLRSCSGWASRGPMYLVGKQLWSWWEAPKGGLRRYCADFQVWMRHYIDIDIVLISGSDDAKLDLPPVYVWSGWGDLKNDVGSLNRKGLKGTTCRMIVWVSQVCKRCCQDNTGPRTWETKQWYFPVQILGTLKIDDLGGFWCDVTHPNTGFDAVLDFGSILKTWNAGPKSICGLQRSQDSAPDPKELTTLAGPPSTKDCRGFPNLEVPQP